MSIFAAWPSPIVTFSVMDSLSYQPKKKPADYPRRGFHASGNSPAYGVLGLARSAITGVYSFFSLCVNKEVSDIRQLHCL